MPEQYRGLDLTYLEHAIRSRNIDVVRHTADSTRQSMSLAARAAQTCYELQEGEVVLSRTTLVAVIATTSILALISVVLCGALLYRQWQRSKQLRRAKAWGRQSLFHYQDTKRISYVTKEVDDDYTRQYRGVYGSVIENSELSGDISVAMVPGKAWEVHGHDCDAENEKLRPKFVDIELGLEDGSDDGVTRKFEIVEGKVRPKMIDVRVPEKKANRVSVFWSETVGVWMPNRLGK